MKHANSVILLFSVLFSSLSVLPIVYGQQTPPQQTQQQQAPREIPLPTTRPTPDPQRPSHPHSAVALLYRASQLLVRHAPLIDVSNTLQAALNLNIPNRYVSERILRVKRYVDQRRWVDTYHTVFNQRHEVHARLEANLLLVEAIQEMRPRLNLSYDGEVRHLKRLIFSILCPLSENRCDIVFPPASTYRFDTYGYTMANLRALLIARGNGAIQPEFAEFMDAAQRPTPIIIPPPGSGSGCDLNPTLPGCGSIPSIPGIPSIPSIPGIPGIPSNPGIPGRPNDPDRPQTTGSSPRAQPRRDYPNYPNDPTIPDIDLFNQQRLMEHRLMTFRDQALHRTSYISNNLNIDWSLPVTMGGSSVFLPPNTPEEQATYIISYINSILEFMRLNREYDEYEPLTLLWSYLSNPSLIETDPQLRDFISGVRVRVAIANDRDDPAVLRHFAENAQLMERLNDSAGRTPSLQVEIGPSNQRSAESAVYVTHTLRGESNPLHGIFAFHSFLSVLTLAKIAPRDFINLNNLPTMLERVQGILTRANQSPSWLYRLVLGPTGQLTFDFVVNLAGGRIVSVGQRLQKVIEESERITRLRNRARNAGRWLAQDRVTHFLITASIALDVGNAYFEVQRYRQAQQPIAPAVIRGVSQATSRLIYLVRNRWVVGGAAILDIGSLFTTAIPPVSRILESVLTWAYNHEERLRTGQSPVQQMMTQVERDLGIVNTVDAAEMLRRFQAELDQAQTPEAIVQARQNMAQNLSQYCYRRMVFHYYMTLQQNGDGSHDLGVELRRHAAEYERIWRNVFSSEPLPATPERNARRTPLAGLQGLRRLYEDRLRALQTPSP